MNKKIVAIKEKVGDHAGKLVLFTGGALVGVGCYALGRVVGFQAGALDLLTSIKHQYPDIFEQLNNVCQK